MGMRYALYAGDCWLISSNDSRFVTNLSASQVRRWIDEMGVVVKNDITIRLLDRNVLVKERIYRLDKNRLFGWREPK